MGYLDELQDTITGLRERVGPSVVGLGRGWGRGSGESIQMGFTGQGWVLVQPSEGRITAAELGGGSSSGGGLGNLLGG